MSEALVVPVDDDREAQVSLADLFLQASQELARSDARLYRSVDRHLCRTREILRQAESEADGHVPARETPAERQLFGAPSFERQSRKSLMLLCKQHGVRGYSSLRKAAMIQRLQEAGVPTPPMPMEALSKRELLALLSDVLSTAVQDG